MHKARKLEVMKRIGLKIAILAVVCFVAPARAGDAERPGVRNFTWCHGTSGQGYMVAPRLAGQRPQYIESQRRSFHERPRDNPFSKKYMWGAVAALGPNAAHDLAIYFAAIAPKPANDGDRELAARGKTIYLEGIPEANIVSCYACHGPNAEGVRDIPRRGGLAYFYLKGRLEQWGQRSHSGVETPMPLAASHLGPGEIEALASYLSFVK